MMKVASHTLVLALVVVSIKADNDTLSDTCAPGLWGGLLEEWATTEEHGGRHGRVMSLPPTKGYYVTDRIDVPLRPPPPPYHGHYGPSQNDLAHNSLAHRGPAYAAPTQNNLQNSGPSQHGPTHTNLLQSGSAQNRPTYNNLLHNGPAQSGPSYDNLEHNGPSHGNYILSEHNNLQHSGPSQNGPSHNNLQHSGPSQNGPSNNNLQHSGPSQNGPSNNNLQHSGPSQNGPSNNNLQHSGPSQNGPSNNNLQHSGPSQNGPSHNNLPHTGPTQSGPHPSPAPGYSYDTEWQTSPPPPAGGKIVNKPNKDKFRPSVPYPSQQNKPIPISSQQWGNAADRVDEPAPPTAQKQVSETDLYLLSAIEKLVYRVDLMEKRLRKMEETMHYLVVGKETKPDPCASNFTRIGSNCYYVSPEVGDWKAASLRCRKMRTHLLELDTSGEARAVLAGLLADNRIRGTDFWTGGLNPGLLWIWAHSARPVLNNSTISGSNNTQTSPTSVAGEGRCLALVHDPALARYSYRGQDCSLRHHYICEMPEEKAKLSNEIERVARELRVVGNGLRRARIMWTDPDQ